MSEHRKFPFDLVTIDRTSQTPMQRQLYASLRASILGGRLRAACTLPPTRTLAKQLGIGRNTVIAAYDQLLAEGYLQSCAGSATWVAPLVQRATVTGRAPQKQLRLSRRGELIASHPQPPRAEGKINLQPGFPESATFPFNTWAKILAQNARRRGDDILGYSDFAGHPRLRETISEYIGVARGVTCTAEQVIVTTGAQAALDLVSRILMDEGDAVWMEEPGYLGARSAFLGGGAQLIPLRVTDEEWRLNEPKTVPRLIYVTPSCQWPRGTVMRMEERLKLLAIADHHGAWIIEDDYDGEYRFRGRPVPALRGLESSDRVIYVGTFGKTLFSALRIGFLVVPRELANAFSRAISVTGQFAPLPLQLTLADFIAEGHFARHLKRMRRLYSRRQQRFVELCAQNLSRWLSVRQNDAGMQVMGRFIVPFDDREAVAAALRRGLELQAVSINFFKDPPEHGLLLGFAGLEEHKTEAALAALSATFRELESRRRKRIGSLK